MIIKDIFRIDLLAEQMLQYTHSLVAIDIKDYNCIKNSSTTLNATSVKFSISEKAYVDVFIETIKAFSNENAHRMLLQICVVGSSLKAYHIKTDEMVQLFDAINGHFGEIDVVWGLSDCIDSETSYCEINVIVGYR